MDAGGSDDFSRRPHWPGIARLVDQEGRRRGHGRPRLTSVLRTLASRPTTRPRTSATRAAARRATATSLADPPLPGPDLPSRAAVPRSAPARTPRADMAGAGEWVLDARARRDGDQPAATRSPAASCSRPSCSGAAGTRSSRARYGGPYRRGRERGLRALSRACCRCAASAATGGFRRAETKLVGAQSGNALRLGDQVVVQVEGCVDLPAVTSRGRLTWATARP